MGRHIMLAVVVALVACGGGGKQGDTTPDDPVGDDGEGGGGDDTGGGDMVPPETMDQIRTALDRKRNAATHCLTEAIDAGEAEKNARGAITIGFVIEPDGSPRDVQVLEASAAVKAVEGCVVDVVSKMTFPQLPRQLDWSYTFAFEAY